MHDAPLDRSIRVTLALLFVGQATIAGAVLVRYGVTLRETVWYLIAAPLVHLVIVLVVTALRELFVNADTGQRLSRVNLANVLSLVRLSSAPTVLWLVLLARTYPVGPVVVPITAGVFLTDLLDGQISRRAHQVTRIGRYLDSSSDYMVLFVVSVALLTYGLVSTWLFVIVMLRLGIHLAGQIVLLIVLRWRIPFRTSWLGKASVFAIMALFALSLLRLVDSIPTWFVTVHAVAEYVTAAIACLSLAEKTYEFITDITLARRERAGR